MKKFETKLGIWIGVAILFVMFSFYGYQIMFTDNILVDKDDTVLYITNDTDFKTLVKELKKKGILHDELSFSFLAKLMGYQEKVIPGRYELKRNSGNFRVLKMLAKGRQSPVQLTFNNIRTKEELAEKLSKKMMFPKEELFNALNNDSVCKSLGFERETVMCMFIPNTYEVYWNLSVEKFLERMKDEYDKFWTQDRIDLAEKKGLDPIKVSILASIVEAETQKDDEKPRIAGVYLNRLKKGMKLQADPTVKFALQNFELRRILEGHLKTDSPYNTYIYKGLPPGPINLPSVTSLKSVLKAENHQYIFFCADLSKPGYHGFSETFEEHVKMANSYRAGLDKMNIK
ncbi:MAG: endolytic transglycosylase MltG [Cytophagales bacterium]